MNEAHTIWLWRAFGAFAAISIPAMVKAYLDLRSRIEKNTERIAENERCIKVKLAEIATSLGYIQKAIDKLTAKVEKGNGQ